MSSVVWDLNIQIFHIINGLGQSKFISVLAEVINANFFLRIAVLSAPYAYYWVVYKNIEIRSRLICGMIAVIVTIIVARLLANLLPFENRPIYDVTSGFLQPVISTHLDMENWSSFPSDTAAVCIVLPFSLLWINKIHGLMLTLVSFAIFVVPRVIFGIHYPSDIFVGSLLGAGIACLLQLIASSKLISNILQYSVSYPQLFYPFSVWYLSASALMFPGIRSLKGLLLYLIKSIHN